MAATWRWRSGSEATTRASHIAERPAKGTVFHVFRFVVVEGLEDLREKGGIWGRFRGGLRCARFGRGFGGHVSLWNA